MYELRNDSSSLSKTPPRGRIASKMAASSAGGEVGRLPTTGGALAGRLPATGRKTEAGRGGRDGRRMFDGGAALAERGVGAVRGTLRRRGGGARRCPVDKLRPREVLRRLAVLPRPRPDGGDTTFEA